MTGLLPDMVKATSMIRPLDLAADYRAICATLARIETHFRFRVRARHNDNRPPDL